MKLKSILALPILLATLALSNSGCFSTTTGKVVQAEGVIITSVDVGMKSWKDYVVAGKATQNQVDTVKKYYDIYYNAQLASKAALEKYVASKSADDLAATTTASDAVNQAEAGLLTLLNGYLNLKFK